MKGEERRQAVDAVECSARDISNCEAVGSGVEERDADKKLPW